MSYVKLKLEYIQNNHIHIGRTFDIEIIKSATIKSATIKSATLILLSKVGLGRTFDRSRFWRYPINQSRMNTAFGIS